MIIEPMLLELILCGRYTALAFVIKSRLYYVNFIGYDN